MHLPKGEAGLKLLSESAVAVTFSPALERCEVGALDNDRYGIVVRSLERPTRMGGALPRMPGIGNEWEQFYHAGRRNGRLVSFEPYEILRHDVFKAVEPGADWQPHVQVDPRAGRLGGDRQLGDARQPPVVDGDDAAAARRLHRPPVRRLEGPDSRGRSRRPG